MLQETIDERVELIKLIDFMYSISKKNEVEKIPFLTLYEIQRELPDVSQKAIATAATDGYIKKVQKYGDTYYGISDSGILLVEGKKK